MKFVACLLILLSILHYFLLPKKLPPSFFEKPRVITGSIHGIPKKNKLGIQFLLKSRIGNIQVSWYQHVRSPHAGEYWQFFLKLKRIHGLHNPGGFNVERWAAMRHVVASSYVLKSHKAILLSKPSFSFNAFREHVENAIKNHLHCPVLASIINALTIGSKNLLSPETLLVFQRTGTSHLMAISGLHVGLVVLIAYFFANAIVRFIPCLLLQCPAQRIASVFSIFIGWIYGFLVGFSLPTQRAVIMISVFMLSAIFSRKISVLQRLFLAFLIILSIEPLALFSASFWLSFMAVFWIAYATFGSQSWWRAKLVLNLGLLPITLYYFYQISLLSILANIVAIPWVTMLIVPLCLLGSIIFLFSTEMGCWVWGVAAYCFAPLWYLLKHLSLYSFSQWLHPVNDFFLLLSALFGVLFLTASYALPLRLLGGGLLIPLFCIFPGHPKNKELSLTVLDVGQGLSVVVQTEKHVLVYDCGPRFPTGFDAGRSVLIPFLRYHGIQSVDRLMISHGDNDHIGGSFWLVKHFPVMSILSSIPKSVWNHSYQHCYSGQQWEWDGVQFHILWPPKGMHYQDNNSSCVLRISTGKKAILLTGDIEKFAEFSLVFQKALLSSTVLVAPHHGSRTSSTLKFIQYVHPLKVIMSVGYQNRYHFPAQSILQRYRNAGIKILSTAEIGAVHIVLKS